jgi:hypothetical protein
MAETRRGKKEVHVKGYTRPDGTKVPAHYRSTPNTSRGAARKGRRK